MVSWISLKLTLYLFNFVSFKAMNYNSTVQNAILDSRRVFSPDMLKDRIRQKLYTDKTVFLTNDSYQLELLEGMYLARFLSLVWFICLQS
jgi:hypothetical protein